MNPLARAVHGKALKQFAHESTHGQALGWVGRRRAVRLAGGLAKAACLWNLKILVLIWMVSRDFRDLAGVWGTVYLFDGEPCLF